MPGAPTPAHLRTPQGQRGPGSSLSRLPYRPIAGPVEWLTCQWGQKT